MRRLTAMPAAAVMLTAFAVTTPAHAAPTCPDIMTFAVGGVGDGGPRYVPGINGPVTRIDYSASLAPVGPVGGNDSVREGEHALDTAARAYRQKCPDSTIVLQGNSLGALIAGNVRDNWANDPTMSRNTRAVLIADPRADNGAMATIFSFIPGFTHTGPRPKSNIPTATTCRDSDLICDARNPITDPGHTINGLWGYLTGEHGYTNDEVRQTPGDTIIPGTHIVPDMPQDMPELMPTPWQMLEPIARELVPTAPIIIDHYEPVEVRDYLPPAIKRIIPSDWGRNVLPPLP